MLSKTPDSKTQDDPKLLNAFHAFGKQHALHGVTFFRDVMAKTKRHEALSSEELADIIRQAQAPTKGRLGLLKLATFGDTPDPKNDSGSLRYDDNVLSVEGVEGDHDDNSEMTFKEAVEKARRANIHCVVYTSPSHKPDAERWRVLAPFAQSLAPSERGRMMDRLAGVFGPGVFEGESWTLSQTYYYGKADTIEDKATKKKRPGHPVSVVVVPGDFIDERPDLDARAVNKLGEPLSSNVFLDFGNKSAAEYERLDRDAAWADIQYGRNVHATTRDLIASFVSRGEPLDPAIDSILEGLLDRIPQAAKWDMHKERRDLQDMAIGWIVKHPELLSRQGRTPEWLLRDRRIQQILARGPSPSAASSAEEEIEMVCAADIKMKSKEWLWEGHLLRGALQLMTGVPGLGKSQVQIHFIACVTSGLPWPDGSPAIKPMNVIMVTAEDALDAEVVPRLTAAGANLNRVQIIKCIKTDKKKRQFLLVEDLTRLERAITKLGNVGLICIDPITAYMGGKADAHKTTEVRSQLGPLKDLSEATNVAISAITHPAKSAGNRAMDHFIASQAFIAQARVGHACFEEQKHDEDTGETAPTGRVLFTHVKHSGSTKKPTLAYKIETVFLTPEPFVKVETSRVVWEKDAVNISADQAASQGGAQSKRQEKVAEKESSELVNLIRDMIRSAGGWCKQTDIAVQAKALGYSEKELRTARNYLAITSKKESFDGPWLWGWEAGKAPVRFSDPPRPPRKEDR